MMSLSEENSLTSAEETKVRSLSGVDGRPIPTRSQINAPAPVSVVVPGRNCAQTLALCLESVIAIGARGALSEIIFVDDGSKDDSAAIAARHGIKVLRDVGRGAGAARNRGWQVASAELIWFIDSDCVANPDALECLLPHLMDPAVAGVGGSYANLVPHSMLGSLIHEEIVARHRAMPRDVDHLGTFNVLYRKAALAAVGGFNESLKLAQDMDLAYRLRSIGSRLCFDIRSKVGHHHPTRCLRYLRGQARHGYYRMLLYSIHPSKLAGDSYAGLVDYVQPPLAIMAMVATLLLPWSIGRIAAVVCLTALALVQIPMASRLQSTLKLRLLFVVFGTLRACARGLGMAVGVADLLRMRMRPISNKSPNP
jgi:GT2 family glycosyltransferase